MFGLNRAEVIGRLGADAIQTPTRRSRAASRGRPVASTELARAYVGTIRLKLFKIAAVILINTRRVKFLLASTCPYQSLYFLVARRLASG